MNLVAVNVLNIGLMLLSAAVACFVPFETFLLVYAVLGPLHYLTQISWLQQRQYFTQQRSDWLVLGGMTVVMTALSLAAMIDPRQRTLALLATDLMFWSLGWSLVVLATRDRVLRVAGGVVFAIAALLLHGQPLSMIVIGLLVPTVLHVFVFTAIFVLSGSLKGRSLSGGVSFVVLLACGASLLFVDLGDFGYRASEYVNAAYDGVLAAMHGNLMHTFGLAATLPVVKSGIYSPFGSLAELLQDDVSVRMGRFLAFIYTYHYLNWFSKTRVIRWHEVPRSRLVVVVVVWLLSVLLYAIDYSLGLRWLLLLSTAHVVLEFPLDWKTLLAIPGQALALRKGGSASGDA